MCDLELFSKIRSHMWKFSRDLHIVEGKFERTFEVFFSNALRINTHQAYNKVCELYIPQKFPCMYTAIW